MCKKVHMRRIRLVLPLASLVVALTAAGCASDDSSTSDTWTPPEARAMKSAPPGTVQSPPQTVTETVRPRYRTISSDDCTVDQDRPCRRVKITVPKGQSKPQIAGDLIDAARQASSEHGSVRGIVFAYVKGSDTAGLYSAGRALWGPDEDTDRERASDDPQIDYVDEYFQPDKAAHKTRKGESARKLDAAMAKIDDWEARRESGLDRRIGEGRRRRIYFDEQKAMNDAMQSPAGSGDVKASIDANVAEVCHKYHVSADDADIIRTEGDKAGWPEPE